MERSLSAASSAEEMSTATEQMAGLAQELQGLVGKFKIAAVEARTASDLGNGARQLAVVS